MRLLTVPGYTGASPGHWLSHLERDLRRAERVEQRDWNTVEREGWVRRISDAIEASDSPAILIGHSCGAVACAQFLASASPTQVIGAVLVAPPDVEDKGALPAIQPQAPLPAGTLSVPTHMIVSDNDPHLSLDRAAVLADTWGCSLETVERGGHLATADGYGRWPYIHSLLGRLSTSPTSIGENR